MRQKQYRLAQAAFIKAAKNGSIEAYSGLTQIYSGKTNNPIDVATEIKLYNTQYSTRTKKLATAEDQLIEAILHEKNAELYGQNNRVNEQDEENKAAIAIYQKLAAKNNPEALYGLGLRYYEGTGVPKDPAKAAEYFEKTIAQKNPHSNAYYYLGLLYEFGRGVKEDKQKALKLYRQADKHGNTHAILHLGMMYEFGQGVKPDQQQALVLYQRAAKQGNANAVFHLKSLLKEADKDDGKPLTSVKKAFDDSDLDHLNQQAGKYIQEQDYGLALAALVKAANNGSIEACNRLAELYRSGVPVAVHDSGGVVDVWSIRPNNKNAIYWYEKAGKLGDKKVGEKIQEIEQRESVSKVNRLVVENGKNYFTKFCDFFTA